MIKWLASIVGAVFSLKTFFAGVFMAILGIILYNLSVDMIEEVMNFAVSKITGTATETFVNPTFTGFAGWVLAQFKIPEIISVIVTFVSLKFVLRKIPFIRW